MLGSDISPMVTTVAPTMPVEAAINMPTNTTVIASPPRKRCSRLDSAPSRPSAILVFSSTTPMKTNRGTAIRVWLVTMPKSRSGVKSRSVGLNAPVRVPTNAKMSATPASVMATG